MHSNSQRNPREGAALLVVMGVVFVGVWLVGMAATSTIAHVRRARFAWAMEQAFFSAEGGAERAASAIADAIVNGTAPPPLISGEIGPAAYVTAIVVEPQDEGSSSIEGSVRINPNNAPDSFFFAELPDGNRITRTDLLAGFGGYEGPAKHVHFRPMGGGSQDGLTVNGSPYPLQNNHTHDILADDLTIRIWNDNPAQAMGHWWIRIDSEDATVSSGDPEVIRRDARFTIVSEGTVGRARRSVTIVGLHRASWARYALWYDSENPAGLWMVGGEVFEGPVYANQRLRFHSYQVASHGQARFFDRVSSTHSSIQRHNNTVHPIFDRGLTLDAPTQSVSSIDLDEMRAGADLEFEGPTSIVLDGDSMRVTNPRHGLAHEEFPIPEEGSVYVRTMTTGAPSSRPGDLTVSGPDGLDGRVTLIADRHINVVDHIRYAVNPMDDPSSNNALGLIAGHSVVVRPDAPTDLEIFAHIIARDSGFGVEDYDNSSWGHRGTLLVFGGIVNTVRNAVGSTAGTGYTKNYIYDRRFQENPPPKYPVLENQFEWERWDDR